MLKAIYPLAVCCCLINSLTAQSVTAPLPEYALPSVSLADGQTVTNGAILGPTDELLLPYVATQALYGSDYYEWCLRWNRLEEYLAEKRARPPRTLRGWATTLQGYSEGTSGGYGFVARPTRYRNSYTSTSDSREQQWQLGGYGGGPVTIYNPFVTR